MAFSGNGTGVDFENAFEITTLAELREINDYLDDSSNTSGNHDVHFKLMNDLDATFATQNESGDYYNAGAGWDGLASVAATSNQFFGHLHFNGFKIIGLKINRDVDRIGLFRYFFGTAYDVWMEDVDITNAALDSGAFAGRIESPEGKGVFGWQVTGSVSGPAFVGGLFGSSHFSGATGIVRDGINYASLTNTGDHIGGACGRLVASGGLKLDKCIGIGSITTGNSSRAGKVVGRVLSSEDVTNCFGLNDDVGTGQGDPTTILTQSQLRDIDTYTDLATTGLDEVYDMVLKSAFDGSQAWAINDGVAYPEPGFTLDAAPLPAGNFKINGDNKEGANVVLIQADDKDFLNVTVLDTLTTDASGDWEYTGESYDPEKELGVLIDYVEGGERWSRFKWAE